MLSLLCMGVYLRTALLLEIVHHLLLALLVLEAGGAYVFTGFLGEALLDGLGLIVAAIVGLRGATVGFALGGRGGGTPRTPAFLLL